MKRIIIELFNIQGNALHFFRKTLINYTMMKQLLLLFFVVAFQSVSGQKVITINQKGNNLKSFYLSLNVENGWLAGKHVNWEIGMADYPDATSGNHTHCSAFVAAACKRMNIYILRPPEHKQELLANAQYEWLPTPEAVNAGWKPVAAGNSYEAAQRMANNGVMVVAICRNPDEKKPGHAALVMPADLTINELNENGPAVIMAGTHNHAIISLRKGFKSHLTGWPDHSVSFYYNQGR